MIIDILQKELLTTKEVTTSSTDQQASLKKPINEVTTDVRSSSKIDNHFGEHRKGSSPSCTMAVLSQTNLAKHNQKGDHTCHYETWEENTSSVTHNQLVTKIPRVKGNKIDTIINGTTGSYRHILSSTLNSRVHYKVKIQTDKLLKAQKARSFNKATKKVILIGDGHTRNCMFSLQDNLNNDYIVTSFVKPGAKISVIVKTTSEELKSLKDGDSKFMGWLQ